MPIVSTVILNGKLMLLRATMAHGNGIPDKTKSATIVYAQKHLCSYIEIHRTGVNGYRCGVDVAAVTAAAPSPGDRIINRKESLI